MVSGIPDAGTWCEAWTVRDIVAHQAGNAEELAWVLGAHLQGESVGTRSFEEREGPLRALNDAEHTTIRLAQREGPATLETDAAARVLLLWGRRPADPARICSRVGPETLGRVRGLLSGY